MKPGLYPDIAAADYHADALGDQPRLSQSIAKVLLRQSPLHAYWAHPRLGNQRPEAPSADMERGDILHQLILGSGRGFVTVNATDYRTQAAKDARDKALADGLTPVLGRKLADYRHAAIKMRRKLPGGLAGFQTEATALWDDPETGIACKGRYDAVNNSLLVDVKVCADAARSSRDGAIVGAGYHVQAAAYAEGYEVLRPELAGRAHYELHFCEPEEPYAVAVVEVAGDMLALGLREWHRACRVWAECLTAGNWPGYQRRRAQAPAWAVTEEMERQMTETTYREDL